MPDDNITNTTKPTTNTAKRKHSKRRSAFGTVQERDDRPGFYVLFTWEGKRYRRAVGPDRRVAERNLARAHSLLADGKAIGDVLSDVFGDETGSRLTFKDAVPLYLESARMVKRPSTWKSDVSRLRIMLAAPWAGKHLTAIRSDDLVRWAEERRKQGVTPAGVNRDLALASALYGWAIHLAYVEENPFRRVKRYEEPKGREVYLTAEESRALVNAASPVLRPVLVCVLSTGMRRGELLGLAWRDVDIARRVIVVRPENEKTKRGREIPIVGALLADLQALRTSRNVHALDGSDRIFVDEDGAPLPDWKLRDLFESTVKRCEAIAPLKREGLTFHDLRHTAASLMVQAGVSLLEVKRILGHSTTRVTERYAHLAPESGRSAIDKLDQALSLGGVVGGPAVKIGG